MFLGLISGTFLHSVLEMAETDTDLMNLGYWVPLAPAEKSPRFEDRDPWSVFPPSYKPVYSPPSARTGSVSRHHNYHHTRPVNTTLHLNVQKFLQQELSRSQEVRRRLREKSEDV